MNKIMPLLIQSSGNHFHEPIPPGYFFDSTRDLPDCIDKLQCLCFVEIKNIAQIKTS